MAEPAARVCQWSLGNAAAWGQKDHFYAAYQCFYRHQYEIPLPLFSPAVHTDAVEARYRELVERGLKPLIVDCGANIGASVLWFINRYPEAHVIAVEPATANLVLLRENVAGLDVVIVEGGIGGSDGTLRLDGKTSAPLSFRVVEGGTGHEVKLFSMASVLELAGDAEPFILKVDIEGGEKALFASDPAVLARFPVIILNRMTSVCQARVSVSRFCSSMLHKGETSCLPTKTYSRSITRPCRVRWSRSGADRGLPPRCEHRPRCYGVH